MYYGNGAGFLHTHIYCSSNPNSIRGFSVVPKLPNHHEVMGNKEHYVSRIPVCIDGLCTPLVMLRRIVQPYLHVFAQIFEHRSAGSLPYTASVFLEILGRGWTCAHLARCILSTHPRHDSGFWSSLRHFAVRMRQQPNLCREILWAAACEARSAKR